MTRPRKRFGQNFLIDRNIIERIVSAIEPKPGENVFEIGPGQGALTGLIASTECNLTLIEIDRDLTASLATRFPQATILNKDVLKVEMAEIFAPGPARIVGNLPYNISTPLLFRLFPQSQLIGDMHFMLQREVVDRMNAVPSTKDYGRLSIMTQYHCDVEKLFEVPPESFSPRPKVQSAVIRLVPRDDKPSANVKILEELLTHTFSFRRKTLRNAMKSYLSESDFHQLGIDPTLRPENLDIQRYVECANLVERNQRNS